MKSERPLSPHLQVYKWQLSSLLSITHRLTSIINLTGITFFALWICMLFLGENIFSYYEIFVKTFIGKFIFIGFSWSFSYHLLNGIRHMFWDMGYGYDLKVANLSGIIVLILSFLYSIVVFTLSSCHVIMSCRFHVRSSLDCNYTSCHQPSVSSIEE